METSSQSIPAYSKADTLNLDSKASQIDKQAFSYWFPMTKELLCERRFVKALHFLDSNFERNFLSLSLWEKMRCHRLFLVIYNKLFIRKYMSRCALPNYQKQINKIFEKSNFHLNQWYSIVSLYLLKLFPTLEDVKFLNQDLLHEEHFEQYDNRQKEDNQSSFAEEERSQLTRAQILGLYYNISSEQALPESRKVLFHLEEFFIMFFGFITHRAYFLKCNKKITIALKIVKEAMNIAAEFKEIMNPDLLHSITRMRIFVANFYFECEFYTDAIQRFEEVLIYLKIEIRLRYPQKDIGRESAFESNRFDRCIMLFVLTLYMVTWIHDIQINPSKVIETIGLSNWFCDKFLTMKSSWELKDMIKEIFKALKKKYEIYLMEFSEMRNFIRKVLTEEENKPKNTSDNISQGDKESSVTPFLNEMLYSKMNYQSLTSSQFIIRRAKISYSPSPINSGRAKPSARKSNKPDDNYLLYRVSAVPLHKEVSLNSSDTFEGTTYHSTQLPASYTSGVYDPRAKSDGEAEQFSTEATGPEEDLPNLHSTKSIKVIRNYVKSTKTVILPRRSSAYLNVNSTENIEEKAKLIDLTKYKISYSQFLERKNMITDFLRKERDKKKSKAKLKSSKNTEEGDKKAEEKLVLLDSYFSSVITKLLSLDELEDNIEKVLNQIMFMNKEFKYDLDEFSFLKAMLLFKKKFGSVKNEANYEPGHRVKEKTTIEKDMELAFSKVTALVKLDSLKEKGNDKKKENISHNFFSNHTFSRQDIDSRLSTKNLSKKDFMFPSTRSQQMSNSPLSKRGSNQFMFSPKQDRESLVKEIIQRQETLQPGELKVQNEVADQNRLIIRQAMEKVEQERERLVIPRKKAQIEVDPSRSNSPTANMGRMLSPKFNQLSDSITQLKLGRKANTDRSNDRISFSNTNKGRRDSRRVNFENANAVMMRLPNPSEGEEQV